MYFRGLAGDIDVLPCWWEYTNPTFGLFQLTILIIPPDISAPEYSQPRLCSRKDNRAAVPDDGQCCELRCDPKAPDAAGETGGAANSFSRASSIFSPDLNCPLHAIAALIRCTVDGLTPN